MSESKFDLCSRALQRVGCKAITSFDDNTTESIVAGREYDPLLEAKLCGPPRWRFAATQYDLNLVTGEPKARWSYIFQIPADCLVLHAVTDGQVPVPYDRYGDKIYADQDQGLVADYTYRPDESLFPAYFREALVVELAAKFALGIKRNSSMAADLRGEAEKIAWPRARILDSQQQTTRRVRATRLTGVRG